jgi:hypothetical protein
MLLGKLIHAAKIGNAADTTALLSVKSGFFAPAQKKSPGRKLPGAMLTMIMTLS